MGEQSFEDLGAVFEAEGKAVNRHKGQKGGEAEEERGSRSRSMRSCKPR